LQLQGAFSLVKKICRLYESSDLELEFSFEICKQERPSSCHLLQQKKSPQKKWGCHLALPPMEQETQPLL
jgi:hypothetical protein